MRGEIDAANAKEFAVAVCDVSSDTAALNLDLTEVEFIAVDGIAALHAINAHRTRLDVSWGVVPGRAVRRVLDLCDPEGLIPIADCPAAPDVEADLAAAEPA